MIPAGEWRGNVRVWFEPTSDVIESEIIATTSYVLDGKTLRIDYKTNVKESRADGVMILGTDMSTNKPCLTWVDTFHTGGNVGLFAAADDGSLLGSYAAAEEVWGWRIRVHEGDELRIEHFNIMPSAEEYRAIEVILRAA
ncbi:MAG TPA: DUF1579 family protein [Thermoanaerobaculia bacterium]|nr:DUF1579 family protein [Thermoanaerobaculia bacterium]